MTYATIPQVIAFISARLSTVVKPLHGASSIADGEGGLVPKPLIGDHVKYLKGDGTWGAIETSAVSTAAVATWSTGVEYTGTGSLLYDGGRLYRVQVPHTTSAVAGDLLSGNIVEVGGLDADVGNWTASLAYRKGQLCIFNGQLVQSLITHVSNNFAVDCIAGRWKFLANSTVSSTVSGIGYYAFQGQIVNYSGQLMLCLVSHAAGAYIPSNWQALQNTFQGANTLANGEAGTVPRPMVGDQTKYLKGDGTWAEIVIPTPPPALEGWRLNKAYTTTEIAVWQGQLVYPNANIEANVGFAWGSSGTTWAPYLEGSVTFHGVYSALVIYEPNMVVAQSHALGKLYRCLSVGNFNNPLSDLINWEPYSQTFDFSSLKDSFATKAQGDKADLAAGNLATTMAIEVVDRNDAITGAMEVEISARNNAIAQAVGSEVTNRNSAIGTAVEGAVLAIGQAVEAEVGNRNIAIASAIVDEATVRDNAIVLAIANEATARDSAIASAVGSETNDRNLAIEAAMGAEALIRSQAITDESNARVAAIGSVVDSLTQARVDAIDALNRRNIAGVNGFVVSTDTTLTTASLGLITLVDTTAGAVSIALPTGSTPGDSYPLADAAGTWGTHSVTLSTSVYHSVSQTAELNIANAAVVVTWVNETVGWVIF
jgi:hypothetical protein